MRPGRAGPSRMRPGTYVGENRVPDQRARALPPRQGSIDVGSGREFRPTFPRVAIVTLDLSPWRGSADHDPFYLSLGLFLSSSRSLLHDGIDRLRTRAEGNVLLARER